MVWNVEVQWGKRLINILSARSGDYYSQRTYLDIHMLNGMYLAKLRNIIIMNILVL